MNKKIISLLVLLSLFSFIFNNSFAENELYDNDYITAANILADKWIINNHEMDPQNYNLEDYVLRQEIAAVTIWIAWLDKKTVCDWIFNDVLSTNPNNWACYSVEALVDANLIAKNENFRPEANISKAEAIGMIVKSAWYDYNYDSTSDKIWQEQVVDYAYNNWIIDSKFSDYNASATRWWIFYVASIIIQKINETFTWVSFVDSNNLFAFDLYNKYKDKYSNENIFFSPYSIESALTMTYEWANWSTADEMRHVLHLSDNYNELRTSFNEIYNEINDETNEYKLNTANALWLEDTYELRSDYLSNIENYYWWKATNLDFVNDTENSRITINNWVEAQTNNKIKDLISYLSPDTRLVLTNAIYFKADWESEFEANDTYENTFTLKSWLWVTKDFMHQTSTFNYWETDDLKVIEMNYKWDDLSMLILLPKENDLSTIDNYLSVEKLEELKNNMSDEKVKLTLPKFTFETKYFMSKDMQDLWMKKAFGNADFSKMTDTNNLLISQIIHQTFVEVNEKWTEAAAATAVIMEITAILPDEEESKIFKADHPFVFIIQQKGSWNILFMWKVEEPEFKE